MPSPHLPSHLPRTHLLLDWDSTLTQTDTLALIARIGYTLSSPLPPCPSATHPLLPHQPPQNPRPPPHKPPFSTLTSLYVTDLQTHTSTYVPPRAQRTTVKEELKFLENLRDVEERSVRRVEGVGVFEGVRGEDVDCAARRCVSRGEVRLRRGWRGLLRDVLGADGEWDGEGMGRGVVVGVEKGGGKGERGGRGRVGVVSVGWSARFIRGCLLHAATMGADGGEEAEEMVREMEIVANEIEGLDDEGGSRGMLSRYFGGDDDKGGGIWTAGDKGRVVRMVIAEDGGDGKGKGRMRTVYVGDSVTDLECLMLVDVGICIRDEPLQSVQEALREVLERVGVECRWIGEMEYEHTGQGDREVESGNCERQKGLWWARDFQEVRESALFHGSTGTGTESSDEHLSNSMQTSGP